MDKTIKQEVHAYLNDLRESGEINMFGAGEYLELQFGFNKYEAKDALRAWMNDYG
jgi:hypothetical protein|tara:strand:+ start:555 stop:719 length:165 start_codon:yes stop_codon:yes gene_type:complete